MHKEVGAPENWIKTALLAVVLTPQVFTTSNLILGPVLYRP